MLVDVEEDNLVPESFITLSLFAIDALCVTRLLHEEEVEIRRSMI